MTGFFSKNFSVLAQTVCKWRFSEVKAGEFEKNPSSQYNFNFLVLTSQNRHLQTVGAKTLKLSDKNPSLLIFQKMC
jgi:hypothetical protein